MLSLIAVITIAAAILPYAEANHNLGIELSKSCISLLKLNSTTCPSYEQILLIYPDTSKKEWSGNFTIIDGILQRDEPQMRKHFEFYRKNQDEHLFVDPPYDRTFAMSRIIIEPHLPTYKVKESHYITNDTMTFGKSRWVNERCDTAVIGSDNWMLYLGDTIQYMKSGCSTTNLDTLDIITLTKSEIVNKMQYYQYQMDQWLQEMLHKCLSWKCL